MAARARDFATSHPIADGSFNTVLQRLDAAVTAGDDMVMQESLGQVGEHAAVARRLGLRMAVVNRLRRLVAIARLAAKTEPDLAGNFVVPNAKGPGKVFVLSARGMLNSALPHKDLFVSLGVGDTFFDDLGHDIDQYEGTTLSAHDGRSGHVVAGAELVTTVRECMGDVRILGTFFVEHYPKGSEILAGWRSASNIAGPFRRAAPAPSPEEPPPSPSPLALPAASAEASDPAMRALKK
jgi:hypothetical protein